jgi:hypothetical protein
LIRAFVLDSAFRLFVYIIKWGNLTPFLFY